MNKRRRRGKRRNCFKNSYRRLKQTKKPQRRQRKREFGLKRRDSRKRLLQLHRLPRKLRERRRKKQLRLDKPPKMPSKLQKLRNRLGKVRR